MASISYFATPTGYCIEVFDNGILIDDQRFVEGFAVPIEVMRECARHAAAELAVTHHVCLNSLVYDHDGEADETALFG